MSIEFYELYIENTHCRHIFLALGHDSEYYKTLQLYNDDPYTKSKTSLVRPDPGFPGVDLSYHTVEFSTLSSIPSSTNGGAEEVHSLLKPQSHATNPYPSGASTITPLIDSQIPNMTETNGDIQAREVVRVAPIIHSAPRFNDAMEQTWETKTSENDYTPPQILGDWAENVETKPPSFQQPNTNGNRRGNGKSPGTGNHMWAKNQETPRNGSGEPRVTPVHFKGTWDEIVLDAELNPGTSHQRTQSMASSRTSNEMLPARRLPPGYVRRQAVDMNEPDPYVRPIWSPVAVNKSNQRIDLNLPRAPPTSSHDFKTRTQLKKLCNDFHLQGNCRNNDCPYDHAPIDDGVYLALRFKARSLPCIEGSSCRKHDCYAGHHCPVVGGVITCGRVNCAFKKRGMHGVTDLKVMDTIQPPSNVG